MLCAFGTSFLFPQAALPGQNKTGRSAFQHCKPWISFSMWISH